MKILYTTPFLPYPPIDGGRITPYHHLRGLSERGHQLTMVFGMRRPEDRANVSELEKFGSVRAVTVRANRGLAAAALALWSGDSVRVRRHAFPEMADAMADTLDDDFDVVYLDSLFTTYLLPRIRKVREHAPVALFEHNVESQIFRRMVSNRGGWWNALSVWESPRIERAERAAALNVDTILTLSEDDADALRRLAPGANARNLGPGIQTFPGESIPAPPTPRTALFLGSYHWPPNRDGAAWLAHDVWPRVRARLPEARLVIAGNDPEGRMSELSDLPRGIEARGFVRDVDAVTREAAVCVVPLRFSGGIRLKVVEALANERPVVTTSPGVAGMPFDDEEHLLVRDDPQAFADAVAHLLEDENAAKQLARYGRDRVEAQFSWDAVADRLVSIFEEMRRGR